MDGEDEVASVHGLSLNHIVGLINNNRPAVEALFGKFQETADLKDEEIADIGMEMIEQAPLLVAQIIAFATDAYDNYDATDDIITTVTELRARGVEFLSAPPHAYYQAIPERLGEHMSMMKEDLAVIEKLAIMVDADEDGYLLQIFTKPVEDRPTLFFEIIQRMGAKGFGAGNFKALFESIEREQQLRGTL